MRRKKMVVVGALLAFCGLFLTADLAVLAQSGPPDLPPSPLAIWTLSGTNWENLWHDAPLGFTNLNSVPSWEDSALSVDTNPPPAFLNLPAYGANGTNIVFDNGSLSFFCQPNWTSAADGGTGPQSWAILFQAGRYSTNFLYGCWSLAVSPDGNTLSFITQTNGAGEVHLQTSIDWDAGDWHYVVLTYSATNCSLFLEGSLVTNTPPIAYWPSYAECSNDGIWIGSDPSGARQAYAQFQDLETYDVALSTNFIQGNYAAVSAEIQNWGGSVPVLGGGGYWGDLVPDPPGGFGGGGSGGSGGPNITNPTYTTNSDTAYADYTNFWLTIAFTNSNTNVVVTVQNTLSNLTYNILTNSVLDPNLADWGVWKTMLASNSVIVAPPYNIGTNALFFAGQLVLITGTNQIADWFQMLYFNQLGVNPFADPDGDGLCNYSEYILGTNPTNAYSITTNHTDAQALFLAYTNDTTTRLRLFLTNGPGTNAVTLTLSNTVVGSNYQIYSKDLSATNNPWRLETNFVSTNSATKVVVTLNGRTLGFIGGDGGDPDGDGLPSGYEVLATHTDPLLADTGNSGTPDGYKDPDGDGFVNLQEYYNGTDPLVFNAPSAPANLVVELNNSGGGPSATLTWSAPAGSVTGYVIERNVGYGYVAIATNGAGTNSYTDHSLPTNYWANYEVEALSSAGPSPLSGSVSMLNNPLSNFPLAIVNGPSNRLYLVVSALPANVTNFLVTRTVYDSNSPPGPESYYEGRPDAFYPMDVNRWAQPYTYMPALTTNGTFSIPVSALSNGVALIPTNQIPSFGTYDLTVQVQDSAGNYGDPVDCWGPLVQPLYQTYGTAPFMDGTAQMKQNLSFLMKMGMDYPLQYTFQTDPYFSDRMYYPTYGYPSDYVYASYFTEEGAVDAFLPFEDNYVFSVFMYSTNLLTAANPTPDPVGVVLNGNPYKIDPTQIKAFPTYSYVTASNQATIPTQITGTNSRWLWENDWGGSFGVGAYDYYGIYQSGSTLYMTNGATNLFGLPYLSMQYLIMGPAPYYSYYSNFDLLSPTQSVSNPSPPVTIYPEVQTPVFSTVGYYFARLAQFQVYEAYALVNVDGTEMIYYPTTTGDPMPGNYEQGSFDITNTTAPLILGQVGQPMWLAGYAKQVATNGVTNVFAYLGQYFTNAFQMVNGSVTTNNAGIVSEYGSFFPTLPGQIALLTKPDPDQTNRQGQCIINVIRLSLDVNHDGVMDETFTGPDNTSAAAPYQFWINNNFDRATNDPIDNVVYDDDVSSGYSGVTGSPVTPDCNYENSLGNRVIPCQRDLEDFARLWVSGVSNALSALPTGSTVTLNWGDVSSPNTNNPTIDLFMAADGDGGLGYLTNSVTASNQLAANLYVDRIGPGQSIQLNASTFSNHWAGNHFIWCGVAAGSGQLFLTVADGGGNVLAQSSQFIQISDIKNMYERWTVGDNPSIAPTNNAYLAGDNISPGQPATRFQYGSVTSTNTPYILLVHGWNDASWLKDRFAECAFKRLYWQGYRGRFGSFRWPTDYGFAGSIYESPSNPVTDPHNYDNSEFIARQSAAGLLNKLSGLNGEYPGQVYLVAHSMGNVVADEALRLAGTNQVVNVYVASQAALPAEMYDSTVTNLIDFTHSNPEYPWFLQKNSYGPDTPDIYTNRLSGTSAASGQRINFYNTNDYALSPDNWCFDQELKPDTYLRGKYFYTGATNDLSPWNHFEFVTILGTFQYFDIVTNITDLYTVMVYAAEPRSKALGATPGVTNLTLNVNLGRTTGAESWPTPDPLGNNYKAHFWHSAEFRGDYPWQVGYWSELLSSDAFNLK